MAVLEPSVHAPAPPTAGVDAPSGHQPYVPDQVTMPEFTWPAVVVGALLGIVFGASSLYLVLKVGMTVSASIPVAVLSITLFRALSKVFGLRPATILENNIVQTTGSAGESIAFGVGVTMPALMILGFDMTFERVMIVALLGGLLGILMMIPLRRAFIVRLHGRPGQPGTLLYPEGTACAEVLISGEKGGTTGQVVFFGFGLAFLHKTFTEALNVLKETVATPLSFINQKAVLAGTLASELLGVGYIIGVRTSSIMMAGGVLGYLVLIPMIFMFGEGLNAALLPARGNLLIRDMSVEDLRKNYLLYVGAGCVAAAGVISMARTLPLILRSAVSGLRMLGRAAPVEQNGQPASRTETDMPIQVVLFGNLFLIGVLALFMSHEVRWWAALLGGLLVVLFGFLFVTVSSRLTGEIGSSSNPISGMTVATLMLTCFIFLAFGLTTPTEKVLALSIGAVVCVAASNGGTTSQDLKTGFLVGATPRLQQWAILIGALTSALIIGATLLYLNRAGTVYSTKPQNLPQVTLNSEQLAALDQTETYDGATYKVWRPREGDAGYTKAGKYLVDPATGTVKVRVDPSIMGDLSERDDGSKVARDFKAPKTQVMALIIKGVLGGELNWTLLAIGAMIAITLELCGVSSLAFAVGVYVDISVSAPIFVGGLARWLVDAYTARREHARIAEITDPAIRAAAEVEALARTESSPGVLLASGYIAGGSLAGVLIAFLEFAPKFRQKLDMSERVAGSFLGSDWLALGVFAALIVVLIVTGTFGWFAPKPKTFVDPEH